MAGKLNPWLMEKVKEIEASSLRYIVEVTPDTRDEVKGELQAIPDVRVIAQPADRFIIVEAPPQLLPEIAQIPGVEIVSADTLVWIRVFPSPLEIFRIRSPVKFDPYVKQVELSPITIPVSPGGVIAQLPFRAMELNRTIIYTTDTQGKYIGAPEERKIKVRCAVADTGGVDFPHLHVEAGTKITLISVIPGEPIPWDGQGHGAHCGTNAFGGVAYHPRWGVCRGVAHPEEQLHIKCLSNMGFGMTSWVLDAIGRAYAWGAKVLNMSLGGPLQGSVQDDPLCRLIKAYKDEMIVVAAAGNDGPEEWTIGSPGASPDAVTVGSWSMTDNGVVWFSSRGPSGEFYKENPNIWRRDLNAIGEDLIKPDCCAPGGGRINRGDKGEQILSGCSGWFDPYGDPLMNFAAMQGTSMAAPAASGLIALAVDKGLIKTAEDVKEKLEEFQNKNHEQGYGLITWEKLQA